MIFHRIKLWNLIFSMSFDSTHWILALVNFKSQKEQGSRTWCILTFPHLADGGTIANTFNDSYYCGK